MVSGRWLLLVSRSAVGRGPPRRHAGLKRRRHTLSQQRSDQALWHLPDGGAAPSSPRLVVSAGDEEGVEDKDELVEHAQRQGGLPLPDRKEEEEKPRPIFNPGKPLSLQDLESVPSDVLAKALAGRRRALAVASAAAPAAPVERRPTQAPASKPAGLVALPLVLDEVDVRRGFRAIAEAACEEEATKLRWQLVHDVAATAGLDQYEDPATGYFVFTSHFLSKKKACCGNACRHCPYGHVNVPLGSRRGLKRK